MCLYVRAYFENCFRRVIRRLRPYTKETRGEWPNAKTFIDQIIKLYA